MERPQRGVGGWRVFTTLEVGVTWEVGRDWEISGGGLDLSNCLSLGPGGAAALAEDAAGSPLVTSAAASVRRTATSSPAVALLLRGCWSKDEENSSWLYSLPVSLIIFFGHEEGAAARATHHASEPHCAQAAAFGRVCGATLLELCPLCCVGLGVAVQGADIPAVPRGDSHSLSSSCFLGAASRKWSFFIF